MAENLLKMLNNGFGPVSKKRENRATKAALFILVVYIGLVVLHHFCFAATPLNVLILEDVGLLCSIISSLLSGEVCRRLLLYVEESYHIKERYLGSRSKALSSCVSFSNDNALVFLFWSFSTVGNIIYWFKGHHVLFVWPVYIAVAVISSFGMDLCVRRLSDVEISHFNESQINNVAAGLAWSYYFGYLKLIFPNLHGMINKAVEPAYRLEGKDVRDKISSKKVFIVIPKNCYCYDTFSQVDGRITFQTSLPEQKITRGGVQERVYKNTLYRVQLKGKDAKYVMMEYATPLLSLYDMVNDGNAAFSKNDLDNQVVEFYKTLKQILENDPECEGKFQLVLVADVHKDLASVIYRAIDDETINV